MCINAASALFLFLSLAGSDSAEVPSISGVSPRFAKAGDSLRITGQHFHPNIESNIVYVGRAKARVVESSATELLAEVPKAVQPGPITVTTGGRIAVSPFPFSALFPPFGKSEPVYWVRGSLGENTTVRYAFADLDSDGDIEIIAESAHARGIEVYDYRSGGGLDLIARFRIFPKTVHTSDFDADGRIDLLFGGTDGFTLIRNIHSGGKLITNSFAMPVSLVTSPSVTAAEFVDADSDGLLDAIAFNGSTIFLLKNEKAHGTNRLSAPQVLSVTNGALGSMAVTDLNADGSPEIVGLASQSLAILSRNTVSSPLTPGGFTQLFSLPTLLATSFQLTDIQNDGFPDIMLFGGNYEAYWNRNSSDTLVAENLTKVVFSPTPLSGYAAAQLLDLTGDSFPDLLQHHTSTDYYHVNQSSLTNDIISSGSFLTRSNRMPSYYLSPPRATLADVNADGATDILVGDTGFRVHQNITTLVPYVEWANLTEEGEILVYVRGRMNDTVQIERSYDLRTWSPAATIQLTTQYPTAQFTPAEAHLFYRATSVAPK